MPLIFSYGMLQQVDVQLSTFGRPLQGYADELPGYAAGLVKIEDPQVVADCGRTHYDNVVHNGDQDVSVKGTVYELTDSELAAADRFEEGAGYKRSAVTLASGTPVWVYSAQ